QISDGASATVLMSERKAREIGVEPLGTIRDFCSQAVKPEDVMFAPIPCVRKLMHRTGMKLDEFDLVEHNEAFSSASVGVRKELGIPWEVFNICGGAVALGHPIGCAGNRIVVTLLRSTRGREVNIAEVSMRPTVMFFYPAATGKPDMPKEWDLIPGARGCTAQNCAYRDRYREFRDAGFDVFGISAQSPAEQKQFGVRMSIPYELLSDSSFELTKALRLPTFEFQRR